MYSSQASTFNLHNNSKLGQLTQVLKNSKTTFDEVIQHPQHRSQKVTGAAAA